MRLTVLTDNNTYIDQYYLGEPALCFYIEDGDERILFDTGYSDTALKNAEGMGIDLSRLTAIIFSHGHNDHTRGLTCLWEKYDLSGVKLIAHPLVFAKKRYLGDSIGAPFTKADCLAHGMEVLDGTKPISLTARLSWLGEILRVTAFEAKEPLREWKDGAKWRKDYVLDDSALVYNGTEGLFVITGCSHSGICNILIHARDVLDSKQPVQSVIGGFHLMEENKQLTETIRFLKANTTGTLYPCHCVCLKAKHRMMMELPVEEVGVGMKLEFK
ncbi:MAG: MBL fold metallo-hydrolase [Solobacterium sp.]|nr:MBL fold metallo-hydrolase [Solobacterium sp.]